MFSRKWSGEEVVDENEVVEKNVLVMDNSKNRLTIICVDISIWGPTLAVGVVLVSGPPTITHLHKNARN